MTSKKVERYRTYAANAQARATEAWDKEHKLLDQIPFGQPRIIRPNGNDGGHRRTVDRANRLADKAIDETKKAEYWAARAEYVDKRETKTAAVIEASTEAVAVGDEVTARFTNSGRGYEFRGLIVGRNRNEWKVKTLTHPKMVAGFNWDRPNSYEQEPLGRVFAIPAQDRPRFSANNRVLPIGQ